MHYRYGIEIAGISTDGDIRALSSMKSNLDHMAGSIDALSSVMKERGTCYIQDPHHCGTKRRNRILKASSILPMGSKQVSASHLKMLITDFPKDTHGLVMSDICPQDRQNFASFEKISDCRILDCLQRCVIDSEATVLYLKVCREVVAAFIDENLSPLERVYKVWHGLYFLRAWKQFIQTSNIYTLKENFISHNLFCCIEINAYGMLRSITKFRDAKQPDLFLPNLFSSQPCENTFRQMRSMTTINWTRINFSLQELLHMSGRIELINDIMYDKLAKHDVCFPRFKRQNMKSSQRTIHTLPTNEAIEKELDKARTTALLDAAKLGMPSSILDMKKCPLSKTSLNITSVQKGQFDILEETDEDETTLNCNSLRDYACTQIENNLDKESKFVEVFKEDGTSKIVLKSSIIWLLTESKETLSKDRLQRVQGAEGTSLATKRKNCSQASPQSKKKNEFMIYTYRKKSKLENGVSSTI